MKQGQDHKGFLIFVTVDNKHLIKLVICDIIHTLSVLCKCFTRVVELTMTDKRSTFDSKVLNVVNQFQSSRARPCVVKLLPEIGTTYDTTKILTKRLKST